MADKSPGLSPYNYSFNNPLKFVDPDGKFPWLIRVLQAAQRFANTPTGRAVQRNAAKAWNYVKNDWKGFTQKASRLPSRISNDASRVFNSAKDIFSKSGTQSPYQIAKEGGRHAGQLRQFGQQTVKELQKSIGSFTKNISKHEGWLKDPSSKVKNWNELSKNQQNNIIHHWQEDIKRAKEFIDIAKEELKNR